MDWLKKNWKFLAVVLAAALIVGIVLITAGGPNPENPIVEIPLNEGPETGVYYYDTAEGEYTLSLNSGNIFTITGPSLNKTGKYAAAESGYTLDFVKDEDGTGTMTIDGDVISLQYKDATMRFLRKIDYTVSFNANGGSEVAAVTVLNGKTVAKPADPQKAGSVFIGWYADAACTQLYNFGNETITANVTVYAKWAETVVGQNEYTVRFDLGYEAETLEAMTTIGGKLYNVPAPQRSGYTFAGWWVSMTQNADELTVPYTEDMVFQANTTLFALWQGATEGGKLSAPLVEVYSDAIKWNAVKGASSYNLKITNAAGEVIVDKRVGTNTEAFNFSEREAGAYIVEVTALSTSAENNSDVAVRTFINKALDRVSLFTVVDGGILLWNGVEGAQKYLITVECGDHEHKHTAFDNGTSTTYFFANCAMQAGGIKFTVTAMADGMASSVSETFVYERKLEAVGQILYNAETQSFYWDSVANAAKYLVSYTVNGETVTVDNGSATTFCVKELSGEITLSVVPATQGFNSPEATTTTQNKTSLATPSGLSISGNVLQWNEVAGATGYMVKINTQSFASESNSLDLSNLNLDLNSNTTYNISVMALGAEDSLYCDVVTVGYLAPIESVTYRNNTVTWTPVLGVENYEVLVNGVPVANVSGTNSVQVVLTRAGVNKIEVRYTDMGGSPLTGTEVYAYAVTYDSRSLGGTKTEYLATGDSMMLPDTFQQDGYDFTGWYNAPDAAAGNGAAYTESVFTGTGTMILYGNWTAKTYYVQFTGLGTGVSNITEGEEFPVVFKENYQLPVPVNENAGGDFAGWYTEPGGSGTALTDSQGNCIKEYTFTRNTVAYPFFDTGVLLYEKQADGTYGVKRGPSISGVSTVRVPEYYKGVKVSTILENAFYGVTTMERLEIPATIKVIGAGAIPNAKALKEIVVYTDVVQTNYEVFFSSHDGALLKHDMGTIYLEVFPRGKTGEYVMSDNVDVIRSKVFRFAQINKLVVGSNVSLVMQSAFYECSALRVLEFKDGGSTPLVLDPKAFDGTTNLTTLRLPARLAETDLTILNKFTNLSIIEVEAGGTHYSSYDNMICNAQGTSILYAAMGISGEFTIPKGIQEIGAGAFLKRTGLTKVIIPAYVTVIGESAFENCTGLTEVVVEGERTKDLLIDTKAFYGCNSITAVTVQGNGTTTADVGVTTIGTSAFESNKKLETVTFEAGASVIVGDRAFAVNEKLVNPVYAEGSNVISLGAQAFAECPKLDEAYIAATLTSVGDGAFSGCEGILNVTFAPNGKEITFGSTVFEGCKKLTTINLPATLSTFNGNVFAGCDAIRQIVVDEGNANFITYNGALYTKDYEQILFYPRALEGNLDELLHEDLRVIGASVFKDNPKITSVTISKNIVSIDDSAFYNCYNLATVEFEEGGTSMVIGNSAFAKCSALQSITLPAYTTAIGDSAFESAGLTSFVIPEATVTLGAAALKGTKITEIHFPANLESVGDAAFHSCSKLKTVTFAEGTKPLTLGTSKATTTTGVFMSTAIQTLTLGDRVTYIGAYAFYNQKTLATLTMGPNSQLTEIGKYSFGVSSGSSKLKTVTLGNKLETIGERAFQRSIVVDIVIPNSVTLVDKQAFSNCTKLKTVTFAPGGTEDLTLKSLIFEKATALAEVTLPARLTVAYDYKTPVSKATGTFKGFWEVFSGCTAIKKMDVEPGGAYFTSIDGIVYELNADGEIDTLLYCPPKKTGELVIAKEIRYIENSAFVNTSLSKIIFEEYDENDVNYGQPLLELGRGGLGSDGSINSSYAVIGASSTLTEISLPSHLKRIGTHAFYNLTNSNLTITFNPAAHLERVEVRAFSGCTGLTSIALPVLDDIGDAAFYNSKNVTTITLGKGSNLSTLPTKLFYHCESMTTFEVPKTVTSIGQSAFISCSSMATLTFEDGNALMEIMDYAFQDSGLVEFVMPDTVEYVGINAFENCQSLTNLTLSKMMPTIPDAMLLNCSALENVFVSDASPYFISDNGVLYDLAKTVIYCFPQAKDTTNLKLPETLLSIGDYAFYGYTGSTIELPENLERIGAYAFYNSQLTSLYIPKNVTSIGAEAFYGPKNVADAKLTSLTFAPDSKLTSIGAYAFERNHNLTKVVLPDNLSSLGSSAFRTCTNLEEVILPAALKSLSNSVFMECPNLKTFIMQEGLVGIGQNALSATETVRNKALTELVLPSTVTVIEGYAFSYLDALKTFTISADSQLSTIGVYAFRYCSSLESITLPATMTEFKTNTDTAYVDDNKSISVKVSYAFEMCTSLKSVDMSACELLTAIPTGIFTDCTAVETLRLPPNLQSIPDFAFGNWNRYQTLRYGMISVKEIIIPETVTSIGGYAFNGMAAMETLIFEGNSPITELGVIELQSNLAEGRDIFAGTTSLKTVVLPANLTVIGMGCFENSGVESIDIPATVTMIGERAFKNCNNLVEVGLSPEMTYLGDEAFAECDKLEVADLYFGLEYLGSRAFAYCTSLKKAYIPATVTSISGNPFMGCSGVENFVLDEDNKSFTVYEGVLYDKTMYTLLYYPASLTNETFEVPETVYEIAPGAFAGAQLKNFVVPSQIYTIPEYAFHGAAVETVTFHRGVTKIGDYAFANCAKLDNVNILNSMVSLGNYAFSGCTGLTTFTFEDIVAGETPYGIGDHFFDGCSSLAAPVYPNQMTTLKGYRACLPDYMFANTGIIHGYIPEWVDEFSNVGVFYGCTKMVTMDIGTMEGYTQELGAYYFYGCTSLKEIVIPAGIDYCFFTQAFAYCSSLEKITQYSWYGELDIGEYDLVGCTNLKVIEQWSVSGIEYDEDGNAIGYLDATLVALSGLRDHALEGNQGITYLVVSNMVNGQSFAGSVIETVVLKNMSTIGNTEDRTFANAPNLKNVWIGEISASKLKMRDYVFEELAEDMNIYFYDMTYEEVVAKVGGDAWFVNASEKAHFYFKGDTLPEGVEVPEDVTLPEETPEEDQQQ